MKRGDMAVCMVLVLAAVVSWWGVNRNPATGAVAVIQQDGKVVREINLAMVHERQEFRLETEHGGYDVIAVEPGRIKIADTDCPDQMVWHEGWIAKPYQSLVCLPNRLVIRIKGTDKRAPVDGIVG